ncbi:hypothetical protein XA68_16091 [Ophiocordyceps unilateralis]|uniref:Zn(2)-C6 fungal-type domain-containing protein n=1 Tax=Ophiocordyceps unilateralis TaxID=268505 RepID=A0A2A9P5W9_OPHUN|nr:hypothetical protein XA68_16091 [Ophiocordyceps unilateralis]
MALRTSGSDSRGRKRNADEHEAQLTAERRGPRPAGHYQGALPVLPTAPSPPPRPKHSAVVDIRLTLYQAPTRYLPFSNSLLKLARDESLTTSLEAIATRTKKTEDINKLFKRPIRIISPQSQSTTISWYDVMTIKRTNPHSFSPVIGMDGSRSLVFRCKGVYAEIDEDDWYRISLGALDILPFQQPLKRDEKAFRVTINMLEGHASLMCRKTAEWAARAQTLQGKVGHLRQLATNKDDSSSFSTRDDGSTPNQEFNQHSVGKSDKFQTLLMQALHRLPRGGIIRPPCDSCRRLRLPCTKVKTRCDGCKNRSGKCGWELVTDEEVAQLQAHVEAIVEKEHKAAGAAGQNARKESLDQTGLFKSDKKMARPQSKMKIVIKKEH